MFKRLRDILSIFWRSSESKKEAFPSNQRRIRKVYIRGELYYAVRFEGETKTKYYKIKKS